MGDLYMQCNRAASARQNEVRAAWLEDARGITDLPRHETLWWSWLRTAAKLQAQEDLAVSGSIECPGFGCNLN